MSKEFVFKTGKGSIEGYVANLWSDRFHGYLYCHTDEENIVQLMDWLRERRINEFVILENIQIPDFKDRSNGEGSSLLKMFLNETSDYSVILLCDVTSKQTDGFNLEEWYQKRGFVRTPLNTMTGPVLIRY